MPGGMRPPKEDILPTISLEAERKVLLGTLGMTLIASLILIIALATDSWLILTVTGKPHTMKTGNLLVGSHSGLWRNCLEIKVVGTEETFNNCTNVFDLIDDEDKATRQKNTIAGGPGLQLAYAKSYVAFAIVSLMFVVLSHLFGFWAAKNQRYVIKRVTAALMAITAACVLVCIQVLENSTESKEQYTAKIERLEAHSLSHSFGFSYVLAWIPVAVFAVAAVVFLLTSKKRVGTDIDADVY